MANPPPHIGSNNPFRHSFLSPEASEDRSYPPPSSHSLQKSCSATTTIIEEDENEGNSIINQSTFTMTNNISRTPSCSSLVEPPPTPPPTGPLPEIPQGAIAYPQSAFIIDTPKATKNASLPANGNGHILITIESTGSRGSTPPHTGSHPQLQRLSLDVSQQNCKMWPALRSSQKTRLKSKRRWRILKVVIALVIVVGAVAIGLGISKAVKKNTQNASP